MGGELDKGRDCRDSLGTRNAIIYLTVVAPPPPPVSIDAGRKAFSASGGLQYRIRRRLMTVLQPR